MPRWRLDSGCGRGGSWSAGRHAAAPSGNVQILADGPDGQPAYFASNAERWIRIPHDIVALRRSDPAQAASAVARAAGEWLPAAFADGWVADGVTRDSLYHLRPTTDEDRTRRTDLGEAAAGASLPYVVRNSHDRDTFLLRVVTDTGAEGWSECAADPDPLYSSEFLPVPSW